MRSRTGLRLFAATWLLLLVVGAALLAPLHALLQIVRLRPGEPVPAAAQRPRPGGAVGAPLAPRLDGSGRLRRVYFPAAILHGDPETRARQILADHQPALSAGGGAPELVRVAVRRGAGGTHVRLQQMHGGIPLWGAEAVVSFDAALRPSVVASDLEAPPGEPPPNPAGLLAEPEVERRSLAAVGFGSGLLAPVRVQLAYRRDGAGWQLAYRALVVCEEPTGDWEVWLGARDGRLLAVADRTRFAAAPPASRGVLGSGLVFLPDPVHASGDPSLVDQDDADAAVPASAYTRVPLPDLAPPLRGHYRLEGPYVALRDWENPECAPDSALEPIFEPTRDQAGFEDVMTYYHLDAMQRWYQTLGFQDANRRQQVADPHGMRGQDNSKFVPSLHRLSFGEGGVDDAEDAEVLMHEYGHATQYDIVPTWGIGGHTGPMGEGFGDYLANSYAWSLQPGRVQAWNGLFQWDGHNQFWAGRRAIDPGLHYPEDADLELHASGTLWCSALTEALYALGDRAVMDRLVLDHHYALTGSATMEDAANAILASDVVLHGGANVALLAEIFARWGLVDAARWTPIALEHTPLDARTAADGPPEIRTRVVSGPAAVLAGSVWAHVRVGAAGWTPVGLEERGAGEFAAALALPGGTDLVLEYWLEARDTAGHETRQPPAAPASVFRVPIGAVAEHFEADSGWQPGLPADDAVTGRWVRAVPVGTAAQPDADRTGAGSACMVTANGPPGGPTSDADVDGGQTTLLSPVYDLHGAAAVQLSYWRWYSNDLGTSGGEDAWLAEVSNDGGATWRTLERMLASAPGWQEARFDLVSVLGGPVQQLRLRFVASDRGPGSIVEAALDDLTLQVRFTTDAVAVAAPPAPLQLDIVPNPCNPTARLSFHLEHPGRAQLVLYDARGRVVRTLAAAHLAAGPHRLAWDGRDGAGRPVASGLYVARLVTGAGSTTRKLTVVR